MKLSGRNVFLVGENMHNAIALVDRLDRWKFQCHFARNMRAASALLSSRPVDLVLSNTYLSDGTGYGLLKVLVGLPITAFLCLPIENSCFWLPAIDDGKDCLGLPALWPSGFARAIEEMVQRLPAAPHPGWPCD